MGSSIDSVRVVILGVEYSIKGDVNEDTTKQVAQYVNSKMSEIHEATASRDNMKVAVLSALNIAGELFEFKTKYEDSAKKISELEQKIATLTDKIGDALNH